MAPSARSRSSASATRQNRASSALPAYQSPQGPLNESAQRALQNLFRDHKLESLKIRQRAANNHLTHAAADVNERLQMRNVAYERHKKKQEKDGRLEDDEQDAIVADRREKAEEMTGELEGSLRMIIDSGAEVENVERALKELQGNITEGRGRIVPTQSTLGASQFRSNQARRRQGVDLDDNDSDQENEEENAISENESPINVFKQKVADGNSAYQAMSMAQRYAHHNDYVGFKKIVHDAQYPEDQAPPLPHASTWFPSEQLDPSAPNTQSGPEGSESILDDEGDFVIESERISIKCPLTLLPMKDPVTSQKCPHSFEKEAILSMINASEERVGGSGRRGVLDGQKAMKCPVCAILLTASDLKENPVLVRKIKRIQAAENAQHEGFSDDEDTSRQGRPSLFGQNTRPEEITSSPAATRTPRFKSERRSEAPGRQTRQVSMVPNSQIESLVDEDQGRSGSSAVVDLEEAEEE